MPRTRAQERGNSAEPGAMEDRTSRKRTASIASAVSAAESSEISHAPVVKKRKRSKVEQTVTFHDANEHPNLATVHEETHSQTVLLNDGPSHNGTQPLTSSRLATHNTDRRRVTMSPSAASHDSRSTRTGHARRSLPANFAAGTASPIPRKLGLQSLDLLVQKRLKLRQTTRKSLPAITETPDSPQDTSGLSEDILVCADVDGPSQLLDDVNSSEIDQADSIIDMEKGSIVSGLESVSQAKSTHERAIFEDSIKHLTRQAEEAKANLEILTVELQSMGFGDPHASPKVVLDSIRDSFEHVRGRLHTVMPMETSDDVLESALLVNITDRLLQLAQQDKQKTGELVDKDDTIQDLLQQIDALVEKLTDAEELRAKLQNDNADFDHQTTVDAKYIEDLEARLRDIEVQTNNGSVLLRKSIEKVQELEADNGALESSCEKLKRSMVEYRKSEDKLHNLIARMEKDNADALAAIEEDHLEEAARLTATIDAEKQARKAAEEDAADRAQHAADLTDSLAKETAMLSDVRTSIEQLRAEYLALQGEKGVADDDAASKTKQITDLETQLAEAERTIASLETELDEVKGLHEAEQRQRESAEADLDDTNAKVKDLKDKLHEQGVQANELRQKLFEVQQRSDKTIADLKASLAEANEQWTNDVADQTTIREELEEAVIDRERIINDLKNELADVQRGTLKALNDKETLLQDMEDRAIKLEDELDKATAALKKKTADHAKLEKDATAQIKSLNATVHDLEQELADTNTTLANVRTSAALQQKQMNTTLQDRDVAMALLTTSLNSHENRIANLETENASLERRVESEAESMLVYQAEADSQIESLKAEVRGKELDMQRLETSAKEADAAYIRLVAQKDEHIASMTVEGKGKDDKVRNMIDRHEELKEMFRRFADKVGGEMGRLQDELERVRERAGEEGLKVMKDAEGIMEAFDEGPEGLDGVEAEGDSQEMNEVNGSQVNGMRAPARKTLTKKKTRTRAEAKKVRDSGFGGSSDVELALS